FTWPSPDTIQKRRLSFGNGLLNLTNKGTAARLGFCVLIRSMSNALKILSGSCLRQNSSIARVPLVKVR
ncbi:uncharacterized protein METZ01_LOCUS484825, partial [marine metagenome]